MQTNAHDADALVDRLVNERDAIAAALRQRGPAMRAAAERNFGALGELLGDT